MASRFTYSRWDGTQHGADLDVDAAFGALNDELLQHGDVNAALRRLLQEGFDGVDGERIDGIRALLERLRAERRQRLEQHSLGGHYDEIAAEIADIVDEERHAIDRAVAEASASRDPRRADAARDAAAGRHLQLDLLPDDLAGRIRELSEYGFESATAERRFQEVLERMRRDLVGQVVDDMSSAVAQMGPDEMRRLNDMLAALNAMLDRRQRGVDPGFDEFIAEYGEFFPEHPTSLDELLEQMARRMAAMQAMLNSSTAEQRAQLQQLSDQLLGDFDLRWQLDQLGGNLQQMFPSMNWGQSYQYRGDTPLDLSAALSSMSELGELDQLEHLLRNAAAPGALAEADLDRVRDLLGADAARSLDRLGELTRMLQDAGLIDTRAGRLELTPRGLRAVGANALRDLFTKLSRAELGQHRLHERGVGHERSEQTKPYEFGDPFRLDLHATIRNALRRNASEPGRSGIPIRLAVDDFEIDETEQQTRSATVLMLDLSMSMPMRDNFLPAKKVAMALHHLISTQFPHDYLGLVGFSETARVIAPADLPGASWDFVYGTNMHHGFVLARRLLARQSGSKQIVMITDGEPTAHIDRSGEVFFQYPPTRETVETTLAEALRCAKEQIRINTFVLDATTALTAFVDRMTELNGGRAFYTTNDRLGDYVLVDFVERRRTATRRRAG